MRALTAKYLLKAECSHIELVPRQVHGKTGRGGIGNRQTGAIRRNPVAMRHPNPRCGAIPCKDDIIVKIDQVKIRQGAIIRLNSARIRHL